MQETWVQSLGWEYPLEKEMATHASTLAWKISHVWMWELDYKETEPQRIDDFEPWCWRRLLKVPWTARRSNQSILKEINPEYSLEGLMLKLQYFGHMMRWTDSLEKTLMLGKIEGRRTRRRQRMRRLDASWTQWTWVWANSGRWWRTGKPGVLQSMGLQRVTWLNWTEKILILKRIVAVVARV